MSVSNTAIYGLLGFPLGHSFSKDFFNAKFENERINARYVNFEIPDIDDIKDVIAQNPDLRGLNVTIPYKQRVIPYLDSLDRVAEEIGAVNVIKIIRDTEGKISHLKGYNSDVIGFVDSISGLIKPVHRAALVLGTGGASRAVCNGLRQLGVIPTLVSRQPGSDTACQRITYSAITPEIMADNKVIVNTTPLGMYPKVDEAPDIPYHLLTSEHLCYDLVYNPETTKFMRLAAEHGAVTKNGMEMLVMQALAAWKIWNE